MLLHAISAITFGVYLSFETFQDGGDMIPMAIEFDEDAVYHSFVNEQTITLYLRQL